MIKNLFFILFLVGSFQISFGQEKNRWNKYNLGFMVGADLTYNPPDGLLTYHMNRKLMFGLSFTDKKQRFVLFGGVSFKVLRIGLFKPKFQRRFLDDVRDNYFPILDNELDSVHASGIYEKSKGEGYNSIRAKKSWGLQAGLIFNTRWKINPYFQYYFGAEFLEMYNGNLYYAEGFENGDYTYSVIESKYHILKLGVSIPGEIVEYRNVFLNFSVGYKFTNYGELSFENLPFSSFTTGNLSDKYNKQNNIVCSVSLVFTSVFQSIHSFKEN